MPEVKSFLSVTPGKNAKHSKYNSAFWQTWSHKTSLFLECAHKHSEVSSHNSVPGLCSDTYAFSRMNVLETFLVYGTRFKIIKATYNKPIVNAMIKEGQIIFPKLGIRLRCLLSPYIQYSTQSLRTKGQLKDIKGIRMWVKLLSCRWHNFIVKKPCRLHQNTLIST